MFPWKLNRYSYEVQFGLNCVALDQSKLSNFLDYTIHEKRKDFRQDNPNVESWIVIFMLYSFSKQLEGYLVKKYIYRFYLINNIVTTKRTSATSFPGSLFSASLSRWNKDPGDEV